MHHFNQKFLMKTYDNGGQKLSFTFQDVDIGSISSDSEMLFEDVFE